MRAYFVRMTAKNKQTRCKLPARGIAVGNRFRVDAYFETREVIARIDRCAKKLNISRSRFVTLATLKELRRLQIEHKEGTVLL
jgi:hypothetical protein